MSDARVTLSNYKVVEEEGDERCCWICLGTGTPENALAAPCACPAMASHRVCRARWQLQKAGTAEETTCRFCAKDLPSWKDISLPTAQPLMTVVHQSATHQVPVSAGAEGAAAFQRTVRSIFRLGDDDAIALTFGCKVPGSTTEVTLEGWAAWDAAVYCASVSAGQRAEKARRELEAACAAALGGARPAAPPPAGAWRWFSRG